MKFLIFYRIEKAFSNKVMATLLFYYHYVGAYLVKSMQQCLQYQ